MQFGLLGPLEVHAGGKVVDIPSGRRRALLAVLVLNRGAVVPVEVLLEALWGDATPPSGTATLRTHVARLRSALPGTAANELAPVTLRWREIGYVLEMHNGQLDVYRFGSLLAEGKAALGRGAVEVAVARLGAALELWRGPACAGCSPTYLNRWSCPRSRSGAISSPA